MNKGKTLEMIGRNICFTGSESLSVILCLEGFLYIFTTNCSVPHVLDKNFYKKETTK